MLKEKLAHLWRNAHWYSAVQLDQKMYLRCYFGNNLESNLINRGFDNAVNILRKNKHLELKVVSRTQNADKKQWLLIGHNGSVTNTYKLLCD